MELIFGLIVIAIVWWVIENIIWPLIKLTAQISWYMGIVAAVVMVGSGALFALFVATRAFVRALKQNINPYDTYIDKHPHTRGVKRGYFFGPGWHQVRSIWRDSYKNLFDADESISKLAKSLLKNDTLLTFIFFDLWVYVFWCAAHVCIYVFGTVWTFIFCSLLSLVIAIGFVFFLACFTFLSVSDRLGLLINSIQSRCPNCKRISLKPLFQCPKCGAVHDLVPGPYGIFHVQCSCGNLLATTAFNGRNNLTAICPKCKNDTLPGYAEQFGIQIVGGTSAGKTTFLTAFFHEYKDKLPSWIRCSYTPENEFKKLEDWYNKGISSGTSDKNAGMYSIIHNFPKHAPYQFSMYDIAGEAFKDLNSGSFQQQQFQYSEGIILLIDPENKPELSQDAIISFISEHKKLKSLDASTMSSEPTAVLIAKADLYEELNNVNEDQNKLKKFLFDKGFFGVINLIEANFSNTKYFAVSAIGHQPDNTSYKPIAVVEPVAWIFEKTHSVLHKILNNYSMTGEHVKFYMRKLFTFAPPVAMLALLVVGIINIPYDEIAYQTGEVIYKIEHMSDEKDSSQNTLVADIPEVEPEKTVSSTEEIQEKKNEKANSGIIDAAKNFAATITSSKKEPKPKPTEDFSQLTPNELYARAFQFYIPPNDTRTGIKQDNAKALQFFTMAAERGHAGAQFWLGHMYEVGEGVRRNSSEAAQWWEKSAAQGLPLAQYWLGRKYARGEGVKQDKNKAIDLFRKAAREIPEAADELKKLNIYAPADAQEFNGHYYKVIYGSMTWYEAMKSCRDKGGYLCTITSQEEFDFVTSMLSNEKLFYWLGASDEDHEGEWRWVTGEPFIFSRWRKGEPNGGRTENYLVLTNYWETWLWNDGARNDWPSPRQYAYICEWSDKNFYNDNTNSIIYASTRGTQVNARAYPTVDSASLAHLEEGTPIDIINYSDKSDGRWVLAVMPDGSKGWISARYTQPRLGVKGEHGGDFMRVRVDDLNLREAPNRQSTSLAKLYEGHLVEIINKTSVKQRKGRETWYQVFTMKGEKGWVLGNYLKPYK